MIRLNQKRIESYYRFWAYLLVAASVGLLFLSILDSDISKQVESIIILNIGYHFFYFLVGWIPLALIGKTKSASSKRKFAKRGLSGLSNLILVASIYLAFKLISDSLGNDEIFNLARLFIVVGVVLGAMRLKFGLRKLK